MVDFDKVKEKDLWYTIGLIVTDGSLSIDRRHIVITSKDEDLLQRVRKGLKLSSKIGKKIKQSKKRKDLQRIAI